MGKGITFNILPLLYCVVCEYLFHLTHIVGLLRACQWGTQMRILCLYNPHFHKGIDEFSLVFEVSLFKVIEPIL